MEILYKPCPFCGSYNIANFSVFIRCLDCNAEGPPVNNKCNDDHVGWVDREKAIENWNTRKRPLKS